MNIELVDPNDWADVTDQIDSEFGDGTTKALLGNLAPITIMKGESSAVYLIPMDWISRIEEYEGYDIKSMGVRMGDLSKGKFRFSLHILPSLARITDRVLVVSQKGAETFTYGRSIIKESVVKLGSSMKKGQRVLILNERLECLGLAALSIDGDKLERLAREKLVAKNLVDIGAYMRGA
jgi:ribosome biogenesis protein Nip4